MSVAQGGKFGAGFASAGITQAAAPGISGIKGDGAGARSLRVAVAATVGGTASKVSGGKFANGAITAAFSRAFNDEWSGDESVFDEGPQFRDDLASGEVSAGVKLFGFSQDVNYQYLGKGAGSTSVVFGREVPLGPVGVKFGFDYEAGKITGALAAGVRGAEVFVDSYGQVGASLGGCVLSRICASMTSSIKPAAFMHNVREATRFRLYRTHDVSPGQANKMQPHWMREIFGH